MKTKNRNIDSNGNVTLSEEGLIDLILQGKSTKNVTVEKTEDVEIFNSFLRMFDLDEHKVLFKTNPQTFEWFIPTEYKTLDMKKYLLTLCKTKEEISRVEEEWKLYSKKNLLEVLNFIKYFVDTCRKNNTLIGVGRGSSVSSYILFLLGLHKINSLKFNLDINEFLR